MPKIRPWYKVVTPREDLREGRPLDASEFAVHLDQVRDGRANEDYQEPVRFFERTFLTKSLLEMAAEVVRRLSGEKMETSAVFNMATQFGGGKTHALTLLYHLAKHGPEGHEWRGVSQILEKAGVTELPEARIAAFVGTEFDSIKGRGGENGTPLRKTPWGEIAFQLSGEEGYRSVAQHEKAMTAPGGEVIRQFLPAGRPSLILIDELMNYISRNRKSGLSSQLYSFVQNLSEEARGSRSVVLVVSIPASELEMTAEDRSDYDRLKKLLNRVGKAVIMAAESETSEIIRRRLFEWDQRAMDSNGRILLPAEAALTCDEYAEWLNDNRTHVPDWFPVDHAKSAFESTYPFHPMVLSVFERKWQALPSFQRTRAILRLLALWVSRAYQQGFKAARKDPLIELGSAPLEEPLFRSAVFEQLGESRLEGAVTTDITGKKDSHAMRLDAEAIETIKNARLHRKVATSIFFESNGGQMKGEASLAEIRLDVAGPGVDIGNVETVLEALTDACYYLTTEGNRYRFSLKENLNKRFADRRASVTDEDIENRVREEIQSVFQSREGLETVFFPEASAQILDRPVLTLVVMGPDKSLQDDPKVNEAIEAMTKGYGKSARTYKAALLWVVPESGGPMNEEARKLIAWEDIRDEGLKLDEIQQRQLDANIKKARRDLTESVWRVYKNVMLLSRDSQIETVDLGVVTSSSSETLIRLVMRILRQKDIVQKEVSPRFLVRNWPPAFIEWSTRGVRDAFYASPQFPRLLDPETIKDIIARGVTEGQLAYLGKSPSGEDRPFHYKKALSSSEVEISEDMYIITAEEADKRTKPPRLERLVIVPAHVHLKPCAKQVFRVQGLDQFGRNIETGRPKWSATGGEIDKDGIFTAGRDEGNFTVTAEAKNKTATAEVGITQRVVPPPPPGKLVWTGEVSHQKWTNLYMKVLTRLVSSGSVKLSVNIEATPEQGASKDLVDEIKAALRALGLNDNVSIE